MPWELQLGEKKSIVCLKMTFKEVTLKKMWVSRGVFFEGLNDGETPGLLAKTMLLNIF